MQSHETAARMIRRKLNEMIFGLGLVWTVLALLVTAVMALAATLQFIRPSDFLLPNGLRLENPTLGLWRIDVIGDEGRVLKLPGNEWACFNDRTVRLSGPGGRFAVDAADGRVLAVRRPTNADEQLCGSAGYFTGLAGHDLFLGPRSSLPCVMLNPNLDRFARAQRFRDLCGGAGASASPAPP